MTDAPPMRFTGYGTKGPWHDYDPDTLSAPCGATIQQPVPRKVPGSTFATVESDPIPRCTDCILYPVARELAKTFHMTYSDDHVDHYMKVLQQVVNAYSEEPA